MSQALEALDSRPSGCAASDLLDLGQPELGHECVTHLFNHAALEMVTQSIVVFSAPTSRLVHLNRAACHRLGFTQQQLRGMSLSEIAPQATPANLTDLFFHAVHSPNQEMRVRTVYRHRSGS